MPDTSPPLTDSPRRHRAPPPEDAMPPQRVLEVKDLTVQIQRDEGLLRPLNGVSLSVDRGQAVGVVGESGCGKTMTAHALLRILPHGAEITHGRMSLRSQTAGGVVDLARMRPDSRAMRRIRGGDAAMIFQEPMTAFSPVHTIHNQIAEAVRLHQKLGRAAARRQVVELLSLVGIPDAEQRANDYPFQLSGGMRQRAMIAMALACKPSLLIADEPTTALDVTVQAQVLKLIKRLQRELGLALMLITHDLGVVAHMVDYVYVMYLGRVVEEGPVAEVFARPSHPYTQGLLKSIPSLTSRRPVEPIRGAVPHVAEMPAGCPFHPRCDQTVGEVCWQKRPNHYTVGPGHHAACFKHDDESEPHPVTPEVRDE
ncbi:MAG: ABC transporter ATP-binding protein [Phycisphaeraceae bacterium]